MSSAHCTLANRSDGGTLKFITCTMSATSPAVKTYNVTWQIQYQALLGDAHGAQLFSYDEFGDEGEENILDRTCGDPGPGPDEALNDKRLRVSRRTRLQDSLIGTGFPFRRGDNFQRYMKMFETLMPLCAGLRRPGSAALDLCYVAAGYYDAFFETGLAPWDIAAGSLIVTASNPSGYAVVGGSVTISASGAKSTTNFSANAAVVSGA